MEVSATEVTGAVDVNQPVTTIIPSSIFASTCYTKSYFQHLTSPCYDYEKKMMSNFATEAWNQQGVKLIYYKTDYNIDYDKIYGEDRDRHIERYFPLQGYFILPVEDELVSLFGIEIKDVYKIYVTKQHFEAASQQSNASCDRTAYDPFDPQVGDLIKGKWNNTYYEIIETKDSEGVMLGTKIVWTIFVKIYRDNHLTTNTFTPPIKSVVDIQKDIESVTDLPIDILEVNEDINIEKVDILFNTSAAGEEPLSPDPDPPVNDDPFGDW
jgi:hypothetical protein